MRTVQRLVGAFVVLCALACSSGDEGEHQKSSCVDRDSACGRECSASNACPSGLFCAEGQCRKECDNGSASSKQCAPSEMCTLSGECVPTLMPSGSGGESGFGNGGMGVSGTGPTPTGDGGFTCADTLVRASRLTPNVILVIDQSGSMEEAFGDDTRWNVLRDFLLQAPGGLISDLEDRVRFGLAMYSARSLPDDDSQPDGECPIVSTIAPDLMNFAAIESVYSAAEPIQETPTGDAIDKIVADLGLGLPDPDVSVGATVLVLATDGEPDMCEELNPQQGQQEALSAVERAYDLGIRTFIISVGEGTVSEEHQQAMANAGLGMPANGNAEFWVAGDDASLRAALEQIVGSQLSCEVQLNGKVSPEDACQGRVTLNGEMLGCNDPNGWELSDPSFIRLLGSACDDLKQSDDVVLEVRFPCNVEIVF